jgi:hypothetical protein|tara:strand:+ start:6283 stop:8151 length:1869 start_codon:yes stop_codon:yes gene_type:complete
MELEKLLVKIEADLSDLKRGLDKANNQVKSSSSKMSNSFKKVGATLDSVGSKVLKFGGLLGGAFGAFQIKKVIDVGRQIEDLQVRLKALFGTAEEGARAFDVMVKFASRVPFSLEDIQQASGNLAVVSKDANELAEILEITGNVAGATGLDFRQTAEQIQRSFSGGIASADVFRERGVRSMLGFQVGAEVSINETVKRFKEVFGRGGEFGNVTDDLANTLSGTVSMLQDKLFTFRKAVSDVFVKEIKSQLGDLNNALGDSEHQIKKFGADIGKALADLTVGFVENLDKIKIAIQALGVFLAASLFYKIIKNPTLVALIALGSAIENQAVVAEDARVRVLRLSLANALNTDTMKDQAIALKNIQQLFKIFGDRLITTKVGVEQVDSIFDKIIITEGQLKEITQEVSKTFEDAGQDISSAFGQAVVEGESFGDAMKNIFKSVASEIVATIAQILIIQPLINRLTQSLKGIGGSGGVTLGGIGSSIAGSIGGSLAGSAISSGIGLPQVSTMGGSVITQTDTTGLFYKLSSLFGFANGGYMPPNRPAIVGERGAELVMPRTASTVIPNHELGGSVVVNQSLNFSTGIVPTVRAEVLNMLPTIKQETINAVAETRSRGGSFARTFGA